MENWEEAVWESGGRGGGGEGGEHRISGDFMNLKR